MWGASSAIDLQPRDDAADESLPVGAVARAVHGDDRAQEVREVACAQGREDLAAGFKAPDDDHGLPAAVGQGLDDAPAAQVLVGDRLEALVDAGGHRLSEELQADGVTVVGRADQVLERGACLTLLAPAVLASGDAESLVPRGGGAGLRHGLQGTRAPRDRAGYGVTITVRVGETPRSYGKPACLSTSSRKR